MHRVILLHGIETVPGYADQERNWPIRAEVIFAALGMPFEAISWQWTGLYWSWVWGILTLLPWYRKKLNQRVLDNLKEMEEWVADFSAEEG
ncbi:MAG: hypothetical protein L0Y56_13265, partial [Nitrospira sp.]|nr:hypothetical protein [Nitrospira sp.]